METKPSSPYSEADRDRWERTQSEKREMTVDRRGALVVRTFWLRLTNEVSLQLLDIPNGIVYEAVIPSDKVLDAVEHPYYYLARAGLYEPRQT